MIAIVIAGAICMAVILTGLFSSGRQIIFVACLYPFLPRYVALPVGGEALALTIKRILLSGLVMFAAPTIMRVLVGRIAGGRLAQRTMLIYLTWIVVACISSAVAGFSATAAFRTLDAVLVMTVGVYLGLEGVRQLGFEGLLKYTFIYPLFVLIPLAGIEFLFHNSLFFDFFGSNGYASALDADAYLTRDGVIRSQASFDGPLQFSEFLVFSICIQLYYVRQSISFARLALLALSLMAIITTGSRAGIGLAAVAVSLHSLWWLFIYRLRTIPVVMIISIASVFVSISLYLTMEFGNFENVGSYAQLTSESDRSTFSRMIQYSVIGELLRDHWAIGLGFSRNFSTDFNLAIDNFYLWTALESGFIGLTLLLLMIANLMFGALHSSASFDPVKSTAANSILLLTTLFAAQKLFIQSPSNTIYFFIAAGALTSLVANSIFDRPPAR